MTELERIARAVLVDYSTNPPRLVDTVIHHFQPMADELAESRTALAGIRNPAAIPAAIELLRQLRKSTFVDGGGNALIVDALDAEPEKSNDV